MSQWKESEHVRERAFKMIVVVRPSSGGVYLGNSPGGLAQHIAVHLGKAAEDGKTVLSGHLSVSLSEFISEGVNRRKIAVSEKWIDAWKDESGVHTMTADCVVYSGHVHERATIAEAEERLKYLAETTLSSFKALKVLVSLDGTCWVLSDEATQDTENVA